GNEMAAGEKGGEEVDGLGESVERTLKLALKHHPVPEVQRRAERLLEKCHAPVMSPELMRSVRSIEVLERIDTPEAQDVLNGLTRGDPEARMTNEARASLKRLA